MSRINKLSIMGIRSFENQQAETIKFTPPLTLVVGVNGSGKTTIIECLKYVLTGLQPPNSKVGGAFVHDPKLAGEKEIMAQIKLSFISTKGASLVVTRSLQLTVKKATRSLKTLESQLLVQRDGERSSISSRVAELDLMVPQYLGVSTAVIDNVLFCHQDESLWPMSDSSTLKKKFDEIFEAQKYTKAIVNIKDIRKKQAEELAKYKILEGHAKEDKDRAIKAEKRSTQLRDEIENLREQVENLGRRMTNALELAHKAQQESEDYARILGELEGKRIEARSKQSTISDLKGSLKEVSESDEWLETTLQEFEARQKELSEVMRSKQEQYLACQDHIKLLRTQLDAKLAARGKYEQEKEEFDRQSLRRKNTVRDTAARHNIRGFDDLTNDALVEEFLYRIKKLSKDQQTLLDRVKREHNTEKQEAQSQVNRLTERKAALQDNKIVTRRQIALNDKEANDYQNKVDNIKTDEGTKAALETRLEELNRKIESSQSVAHLASWPKKLSDANAELREQEDTSAQLNDALIQGTKRAGEMARLAHIKQELKERERSLQTLLNAHSDRIDALIGQDWASGSVEQLFQEAVDNAAKQLISAERDRDIVTREVEQVQFKLKTLRDSLVQKKAGLLQAESTIRAVIGEDPSEYEEHLASAQATADMTRSSVKGTKELHDYFVTILKVLESDKPACRVCMRAFKGASDPMLKKAKERTDDLIKKQLAKVADEGADTSEAELQQLLDLRVPYETWKTLKDQKIPGLEEQLNDLTGQRDNLVTKIEKRDTVVEERQQSKKELESISKTVSSVGRCDADIKSLSSQVDELTMKQSQHAGGRTLEDIQEQLSAVTEKTRAAKKAISSLTSEHDQSKADLSSMELELRDLKGEINTATFQLEKKASIVARVEEFKTSNKKLRETSDKTDSDIAKLEPEILTVKAKYDDIVHRADAKEREMSHEAARLGESVNALNLLNEQIQSYFDRGGHNQLTNTNRDIKNFEEEISSVTTEQGRLTREINKVNEQIKDSESTRRRYSDNLRYRRDTRALQQLSREIEELSSHNAEVDRERLRMESEKYTREYNTLSAKQSGLMGEMRSKDAQLGEILVDFETDFIDAPKRYKEAHIKVETTKAAVEDLGRYGGALDKAIMKYHGLKMEEINSIIDDLWKRTYQGTDVDTVLIRADNETARGNRSYNYRVVMVKQGAEMDMRGRCSAGQKVLASIVIRLALAECFSANCGVMALDEPTTNLDQANVRSLAEALHGIIKARQQQANFQFIIITHDEEFLKAMKCGDFTDYFYQIRRNERANSVIERQNISEVI